MSRHHKLFALKFVSNNFRISLQLDFFGHYISLRLVGVKVFLVVDKRRSKLKTDSIGKVVIVDHWHYFPDIFGNIQRNYLFCG